MNIADKGLRYWLPHYLFRKLILNEKPIHGMPIHLFVCVVDHFEPFNGPVSFDRALNRVKEWRKQYPIFSSRHTDSLGNKLQHVWFYPPHLDHQLLPYLVELCLNGYGDIEMHLHHNLMDPFPDTSNSLKEKIMNCIEQYSKFGIFTQPDGSHKFGFIHGEWSLDNSGGDEICGVNNEIDILIECGCYADFTFPCLNKSQPALANSIYYAKDNAFQKKSYNTGTLVKYNKKQIDNSLMMIQGVLGVRYDKNKKHKISIEYSDIDCGNPLTPNRIDYLVHNAISIKGNPNCKFLKLHTHGGPEFRWSVNFGEHAEFGFSYLEKKYMNDKYILHYVTSREMYNIIKSIENYGMDFDVNKVDEKIIKYQYIV